MRALLAQKKGNSLLFDQADIEVAFDHSFAERSTPIGGGGYTASD